MVPCNICDEQIESRQDISYHRKNKHQIFKTIMCKYFPACFDGEECFFSHDKSNERRNEESSPFCPRGTKCSDQSCNYSEANHKNTDEIECRFQGVNFVLSSMLLKEGLF